MVTVGDIYNYIDKTDSNKSSPNLLLPAFLSSIFIFLHIHGYFCELSKPWTVPQKAHPHPFP